MNNYLRIVFAITLFALNISIHAAAPKPSGYLPDYDILVEGEYLEAYWVDMAKVRRSQIPQFQLGEIETISLEDKKHVMVADVVSWLIDDLLVQTVITSEDNAQYRLDVAITHMDPGSRAKRLWAGEFGAGHAQLQIEGKVIDKSNGEVVATFAERRRSSGALGAEDVLADAGPTIMNHLTRLISEDISNELLASFIERPRGN